MSEHGPEDVVVEDDIKDHRVRPGVWCGSLIARTEPRSWSTAVEVKNGGVGAGTGVITMKYLLSGRGEILQGHLLVKRAGQDEEQVRRLPGEVGKPVLLGQGVAERERAMFQ